MPKCQMSSGQYGPIFYVAGNVSSVASRSFCGITKQGAAGWVIYSIEMKQQG